MRLAALVVPLVLAPAAQAQPVCPKRVADAVARSYPGGAITACASATIDGRAEYRVDLDSPDHPTRELDVAPDGSILAISEEVAASSVPHAVMHAFEARHRSAKLLRVERQETATAVTYELVYTSGGRLGHVRITAPAPARSR